MFAPPERLWASLARWEVHSVEHPNCEGDKACHPEFVWWLPTSASWLPMRSHVLDPFAVEAYTVTRLTITSQRGHEVPSLGVGLP